MSKAVFLDRDGVINPLVFNVKTGCYESPNFPQELSVYTYAAKSIRKLSEAGYKLFIVSNQPSYAKGKTSMEALLKIQELLEDYFVEQGLKFDGFYYCYHHPEGIVPEYTCGCECRKPKTQSIVRAEKNHRLDLSTSWLIGDQDTDIQCGLAAGLRTVLIENPHSESKRGKSVPELFATNLEDAVEKILSND